MSTVCFTHNDTRIHTHTRTAHTYISWSTQMSNTPHTKSLAALYLKDTTDWKCVRMCETESPEHSLFSMSVTESGCLLTPLRHTHTHPPSTHQPPNQILAISSIKLQGEKPWKNVQCFKKFSRTASSNVFPTLQLGWIKGTCNHLLNTRCDGKWEDQDLLCRNTQNMRVCPNAGFDGVTVGLCVCTCVCVRWVN